MIKPRISGAGAAAVALAAALAVAAPAARAQDAPPGPPRGDAGPAAPTVGTCTFDVRDQPIDRVLEYVRAAAGKTNIVVAPEAEGERITLALRDAPWRLALDEIARRSRCTVEEITPEFLRVEKPLRVEFSFEKAKLSTVLRTIAALSGANIVSDPDDVTGDVSVNLIDLPWRVALNKIAETKGYQVVEDKGVLRVVSPSKLTLELETRVRQLRYLRPPPEFKPKLPSSPHVEKVGVSAGGDVEKTFSIIRSLKAALDPEGELQYIAQSNSLVLKGTKPKLAQVEKMLDSLDREPLQIWLDMQFVSTTNRDFFDIGIGPGSTGINASMTLSKVENGVKLPFNTGEGGFENGLLIRDDLPKVGGVSPIFTFGSLDFSNTSVLLKLLRNDSRSRIVQSPRLFVLDNQEATIFVGESIRYAQTEASSSQSGTLQFSIKEAAGSPVSVGFQLLMVPHVIPDTNKVMMTLVPSQKTLSGTSTELPGFDKFSVGGSTADQVIFLPRESSSTLVTTLIVEHGTTAILGGLMQDSTAESVQKVPFLGDLPLLGWLFKTDSKSKIRSQLMIFLTPWMVRDSSAQREAIGSELARRESDLDAEWKAIIGDRAPAPATTAPAKGEPGKTAEPAKTEGAKPSTPK